jgi:hypothetical protein
MPATIDIGGKDLYGWAVEMGALQCEELLRPTEAAKHGSSTKDDDDDSMIVGSGGSSDEHPEQKDKLSSSFRILDRPDHWDMSSTTGKQPYIPHLIKRLDELESLAAALSTCLDNLAEEVSVCHGLLLMGGGASALAAHVKSLKTLQYQKRQALEVAYAESQQAEHELEQWMQTAGEEIGKQVPHMNMDHVPYSRTESFRQAAPNAHSSPEEEEAQRRQLVAQIAASENKVC